MPAFFLKANEDKAFWSNVITAVEYTVDVVTTLSGVGNLAKFRYLARLGEAGSLIAKIKLGAGIIEITSGVTNTLLKLTGFEDTKTGKALQEYLFYLELLSLSGELTVAIKNGLQKSAKEVLEHEDDLRKSAKNADEAKPIEEVLEELRNIVDDRFKQLNSIADPVADILGAAYKSHPEGLRKILAYVESKGGEVIYKSEEALGYSPGLSKGQPGQIHIHKEASISAWEHELKHFLDDEVAGFMGMRALGDTNFRVRSEFNAYKTEIDFVKKLNHKNEIEVVRQLKLNFNNELEYLTGRGIITDSALLREIEKFLK